MKRLCSLLLVLMLMLAMAVPAFASTYEDAYDFVVRIVSDEYETIYDAESGNALARERVARYIGTGFAVGTPGEPVKYFATNRHVVVSKEPSKTGTLPGPDGQSIRVVVEYTMQNYLVYSDSTEMVPVNVYAVSDRCDLAVLSLNQATDKREAALLYPQDLTKIGHPIVYSAGFPGISDTPNNITAVVDTFNSYETDLTITDGMVSVVKEDAVSNQGELIQHMAKISGGNSGGPLLNEKGHVVGVNRAHWVEDEDYCLAVSANELVRFLDEEHVPYTTVQEWQRQLIIKIAVIAGVAIVVLAVAAVLLVKKGGKKGGRTLKGVEGGLAGKSFALKAGASISLGYDASRCQAVFPNGTPGVSGKHCTVTFDGKTVKVTDDNSRFGVWIDQTRLVPGTPTVMHRGQKLYLGSKKQCMTLEN